MRLLACIAAVAAVALAVVLVGPAGSPTPAAAQLPVQAVTAPPPEHHADPSLKTYVFRVGPFSIGGYQTFRRTDVVSPPPVAGSIVGMDVRIVDTDGAEIPQSQLMLHHNVFTNGGADNKRKDGASEELRPLTLPRGYGYRTTPRTTGRCSGWR